MSSDHFSDYIEKQTEPAGEPDTVLGWIVIFSLLLVGAFLWFNVIPAYINTFLGGPSGPQGISDLDIPGDGTIPGRRDGELAVVFFDVGFGDGILIQAPDNTTSLIDGGEGQNPQHDEVDPHDWAYELYLPFFQTTGIKRLENLINTVPLSHYMGAQPDLVAHPLVGVNRLYLTGYPATHFSYRRLQAEARNKEEVTVETMDENTELDFGPGAKGKVIFGKSNVRAPDDASHVIYFKYGDISFLFMSHLTDEMEKELTLKWGDSLDVDVLKVGRHGARDGTTDEFLSFAAPDYAVISSSTRNHLYAPADEVLERLRAAGVSRNNLLRTDSQGHIAFYTDGRTIRIQPAPFPFL
ncbi:MAG: ComEC/Rec2 family competence protein [bacterium]